MSDPTHSPKEPRPRHGKEYEDPHYHDDDVGVTGDEDGPRLTRAPGSRKPNRRLPPPRPRYED
jgi:hypothetical protein